MPCRSFALFLAILLGLAPVAFAASPTPSFDCRYAKSPVEQMICASPELAELDRALGETFNSVSHQGGVDAKALRADEDRWLRDVREKCADAACVAAAYRARQAALLDRSQQAASPAAYDETKPFPAPPALLAEARAVIGQRCAAHQVNNEFALPGFETPAGFLPVITRNAVVYVRAKQGVRFAFLLVTVNDDLATCKIAEVVTLPPPALANAFLQCTIPDTGSATPISIGIGMRLAGQKKVVGYWEIDPDHGRLERQPLSVLGAEDTIRCNQPETGD